MRSKYVIFLVLVALVLGASALLAKEPKENLKSCAEALGQILGMPDNVPQNLLDKAECVIMLPSVIKAGFIVGGSAGQGAMSCRTGEKFDGPWGAPSIYRLEGASIGFQIGGQSTQFLLLVMNPSGVKAILKSKAKLGGDASVAAGPKGRTTTAETDLRMTAEVLSYSRSKGVFAGVSVKGSTLRPGKDDNEKLYGKKLSVQEIVLEGKVEIPEEGKAFVELLQKKSPTNKSADQ
jgi:lipid-binding SYLF domain-containing protein